MEDIYYRYYIMSIITVEFQTKNKNNEFHKTEEINLKR